MPRERRRFACLEDLYPVLKAHGAEQTYRRCESTGDSIEVGVDYGEGTPVPIPNTAVKLTGADNTWLEAARNDR